MLGKEFDLFIELDLEVSAEVKAGASGTLRSLHEFIDRSDGDLAVRLHAGPLARHDARTRTGKRFTLLDLPYCLATRVGEHVDWLRSGEG